MLKHLVFFKFPVGISPAEKLSFKDTLDKLKDTIPQVKNLETGINISNSPKAYDLALVTEFENETDLDAYRVHPNHKKAGEIIDRLNIQAVVLDYWS